MHADATLGGTGKHCLTIRRMTNRLRPTPHPLHGIGRNPLTLALWAGLWIAALPNWPLWQALAALPEMGTPRGVLFGVGFGAMIAALTTALLALAAWRWSIKPAIALVLLAAAFGAHFMASYGVVIDATMMTNVMQTDPREVRDLLNLRMAATVGVLAVLPLALLWRTRVQRVGFVRQLGRNLLGAVAAVLVLVALLYALFADLSATMREHTSMRYLINPLNSFYALADLAVQSRSRPGGPPQAIGLDARIAARTAGSRAPLLLLVIGETARADHFAVNGYGRATTPQIELLHFTSFSNVSSCGTSTATSLPCMFSALGKAGFERRDHDHENLLDLVQRSGMAVLWLDNQAGCKSLCERVPNAYAHTPATGAKPLPPTLCADDECLDEALLAGLDERLAALPAERRERGVLLVLHQMGSHGPAYYKRSPPERKPFVPECRTNALQQCDRQSLVNAYDNSIAYTDVVLAQAVQWLMRQRASYDPALLYVSDHGESLGENNIYLHGLPYAVAPREQTHVPMLWWQPDPAATLTRPAAACLKAGAGQALTHDNLFHTALGALGVQASEYKPALDAFAACRAR